MKKMNDTKKTNFAWFEAKDGMEADEFEFIQIFDFLKRNLKLLQELPLKTVL